MAFLNNSPAKLFKKNWIVTAIFSVITAIVSFVSGRIVGRRQQSREDEKLLARAHMKVCEYQAKLDSAADNVRLMRKYRRLLDAAVKRVDELEGGRKG